MDESSKPDVKDAQRADKVTAGETATKPGHLHSVSGTQAVKGESHLPLAAP